MPTVRDIAGVCSAALLAGSTSAKSPEPFFLAAMLTDWTSSGIETTGTFVNVQPLLTPPTAETIADDPRAAVATYLAAGGAGPVDAVRDAVAWELVAHGQTAPGTLHFAAADFPGTSSLANKRSRPVLIDSRPHESLFVGRVVTQLGETVTARITFAASGSAEFALETPRGFFDAELDGPRVTEWDLELTGELELAPHGFWLAGQTSEIGGLQVVDLYLLAPAPGSVSLLSGAMLWAARRRR